MSDLRHKDTCPGASVVEFVGKQGDRMEACRACGRAQQVDPSPAPAAPPPRRPSLDAASLDAAADRADRRQSARDGSRWPTHKARRRNQRRRSRNDRRNAA